jgi:flagellar biosynthesis/type III secretory pathway protein FliH
MGDKPPSRRRYEEQNPTVSFRISKDKKEELDSLVKELGITKKEWLEGVIGDDREQFNKAFDDGFSAGKKGGYDTGYDEGREDGREDAKDEFVITVPCSFCDEPVPVDTEERQEKVSATIAKLHTDWTNMPSPMDLGPDIHHETCPDE